MRHPPFPLPEGHAYAPGVNPRHHDGSEHFDSLWLAQVQQALKWRWSFKGVHATGRLDIATQAALVDIQARLGMDTTGWLDAPLWDAVFTLSPETATSPETQS